MSPHRLSAHQLLLGIALWLSLSGAGVRGQVLELVLAIEPAALYASVLDGELSARLTQLPESSWRTAVVVDAATPFLTQSFQGNGRLELPSPDSSPGVGNPARLLERALYELQQHAQGLGPQAVLLMTAGRLDATDPGQGRDWLLGELFRKARERQVAIHVLAVGARADMSWVQPLSEGTGGSYYRLEAAGGVDEVLNALRASIGHHPTEVWRPMMEHWLLLGAALLLLLLGGLWWRERRARSLAESRRRDEVMPPREPVEEAFPEAFLVDLQRVTDKTSHLLRAKYTLITRLDHLPDSNIDTITVPFPSVGRRHALIEYRDFSFWLIDQNSVNGTYVNGQRVFDPVRLKHGDRISFHRYEFEFAVTDLLFSNETLAG